MDGEAEAVVAVDVEGLAVGIVDELVEALGAAPEESEPLQQPVHAKRNAIAKYLMLDTCYERKQM